MKNIDIEKIQQIIKLTMEGKYTRPQIAEIVGVSKSTVWVYQKKYNLL